MSTNATSRCSARVRIGASLAWLLAVAIAVSTPSPAAATSAAGVAFLERSQNEDGSWGGGAGDIAVVDQVSPLATQVLRAYSPASPKLSAACAYLAAHSPVAVEEVGRFVEALATCGPVPASLPQHLADLQNADGGWGIDEGFGSDVLDTVFAVRGLAAAGALADDVRASAVSFLLGTQRPDGGWSVNADKDGDVYLNDSDVYLTSLVLLALTQLPNSEGAAGAISAGSAWLATEIAADGSVPTSMGTVFETALAYQALVRTTAEAPPREATLAYVVGQQRADGSWHGEAFSTALALQTLADSTRAMLKSHIRTIDLFRVTEGGDESTMSFGAHEHGIIRITVDDPSLRFLVTIVCTDGSQLTTTMTAGSFTFDTGDTPPETCTVTVQAINPSTGIVEDMATKTLSIAETVLIDDASVAVSPGFTHVDATESIMLALLLRNLSNVATTATVTYTIHAPDGTVVLGPTTKTVGLSPDPGTPRLRIPLVDAFMYVFTQTGDYPVDVSVALGDEPGDTIAGRIAVAQPVRIEPTKALTPSEVPPDPHGARVHVDIELAALGGGSPPPIEVDGSVSGGGNIYAAGIPGATNAPFVFRFVSQPNQVLRFESVTGKVNCASDSGLHGADGGCCHTHVVGSTDSGSFRGLSGLRHGDYGLFLIGVFLDDDDPATEGPPPQTLDVTGHEDFADIRPALRQLFFVGDGMTGTGTGTIQRFHVPSGATRLALGVSDHAACDPSRGFYEDNSGSFAFEGEIAVDASSFKDVVPTTAAACNAPRGSACE